MKVIVVGVDGSAASLTALGWSTNLARQHDAELVAVKAFLPVGSEVRPRYSERVHEEHLRRLEGICGSRLDDVRHALVAANGDPRDVLTRVASERDADLLVVARVGESGHEPGFLNVGSVVEYLAHHLDRPLAVIPERSPASIARIVVAVDGSPHSADAVEWVRRLIDGGVVPTAITAITVDQPGLSIAPDAPDDEWADEAGRVVADRWAAPLVDFGDGFTALAVAESPVAESILEAADRDESDLVVLGARGLGGVTGLRIGGVALKVLHRIERPLVLVPESGT